MILLLRYGVNWFVEARWQTPSLRRGGWMDRMEVNGLRIANRRAGQGLVLVLLP